MKSSRLLSIAYNSYTKPKSHESSRYNLWLSHVRLVYSAPSLQVEHCLGFAGEHLTE